MLPIEDANGAQLIDDGVSTVQALVELKAAHAEGKLITDAQLLAIFDQGLQVTVVTYPDNDDLVARCAWNAGKHDEDRWARLVKAATRLAWRRRLWACLGRWLQEVRRRGRE